MENEKLSIAQLEECLKTGEVIDTKKLDISEENGHLEGGWVIHNGYLVTFELIGNTSKCKITDVIDLRD